MDSRNGKNMIEANSEKTEFYLTCFSENLNHARHVENEILTFNSIYMALSGAFLAFASSAEANYITITVNVLMILIGLTAMLLTSRWNKVFNMHLEFANKNYIILCSALLNNNCESCYNNIGENKCGNLSYCFKIPTAKSNFKPFHKLYQIRTKKLFGWFYILVELIYVVILIYFIYQI